MSKDKNIILSEHTAAMSETDRAAMEARVGEMNAEELKQFRNGFDPDTMGFSEEEGTEHENQ